MSDYDRGAYTPQTDAPLAFDPRRPSERRPVPMALIGSGVVLAILLAGVAMVYRGGVRRAGDSPRPVGEPVMAVKTAPPTPAVSTAPANMDVYSEGQGNTTTAAATPAAPAVSASNTVASVTPEAPPSGAAPKFAPVAEQPAPRPAPRASTVAMLAKPTAPDHIVRPATPSESASEPAASKPAETASAAPKAAKSPATHPAHKLDQAELAAAGATRTVADQPAASESDAAPEAKSAAKKPVKTASAATAASTPATTASSGKAVVQIGAFSSSELADKGYAAVSAALPGRMGGKAKHVQPLDKDGTTLYRTWLSGFASREDAVAFCEALKAKGKTCLVKG